MSRHVLLLLTLLPLATLAQQLFEVNVTAKKPQPRDYFVQGLEIDGENLYISTGHYGKSRLLRHRFENGALLDSYKLNSKVFAEGLTVMGEYVFQLTWRNRALLVYSKANLKPSHRLPIPGEGWGLSNNGNSLIYSDGSDQLYFMSPARAEITRTLKVTENGKPVIKLNELEWIDGAIWANIWQSDRIVIINPDSGKVTGSINLQGLLPETEYRRGADVLNGIARNPADGTVWVTGKNWPWLYQIELIPVTKKEATPPQ